MSATPARSTRSRAATPGPAVQPEALPSLQTRASTSYGSRGKATLHSQTAAAASIGQFEDAFSTARNKAQQNAAPKRRSRKSNIVPDDSISVNDEEQSTSLANHAFSDDESDDSRPSTTINAGAMYERPSFTSSILQPNGRRTAVRSESPMTPLVSAEPVRKPAADLGATSNSPRDQSKAFTDAQRMPPPARPIRHSTPEEEPSSIHVFLSTLTRYFPELLHDANPTVQKWMMKWFGIFSLLSLCLLAMTGVLITFASVYSIMPLPHTLAQPRENFVSGMKYAFGFSAKDSVIEQLGQASSDLRRLEELKNMFDESRKTLILQDKALDELRRSLPEVVAVEKVDGKVALTHDFLTAFEQKLQGSKDSPLWTMILQTHEQQLRDLISEDSKATFVAKEDYIDLVRQAVDERFGDVLKRVEQTASKVAASISREVTEEYMRKNAGRFTPEDRLALEKFTRIQAAYDALSTVNFFDPGLGATIVPKLTSSTQKPPARSWKQYLWSYQDLILTSQYAPVEALTHVLDASSCWCAAPSTDGAGKAQLTVRTPLPFYPDTLVIEHIPASGTLDISTAPKSFEVWADLGAADAVAYMRKKIAFFDGNDRSGECGPAPTPRFLCLYRGAYDIAAGNPVQAFKLWYPIERLDLATDTIAVRVTENWGGRWTCLYRLRMTGTRTDAALEFDHYGEPKDLALPEEFLTKAAEEEMQQKTTTEQKGDGPRTVWH